MKSIKCSVIITGIRAKVDGSLGISLSTPELKSEEKVAFMELQNMNCEALINPLGNPEDIIEVKTSLDNKSPSQRLRDVIFVWYRQSKVTEPFDSWYQKKMEGIIEQVKLKLTT